MLEMLTRDPKCLKKHHSKSLIWRSLQNGDTFCYSRKISGVITDLLFFLGASLAVIPTMGVTSVKKYGKKCIFYLAEVIIDLILAMKVTQVYLNYLFMVLIDDIISLDFF